MNADASMLSMVGDILPEIAMVVGGVAVLLYALVAPRGRQRGAAWLALATTLIAAVLSVAMLGGVQMLTFFGTYARDDVAASGRLIVLGATAVTIVLSVPWFAKDPRHGEYYTLLLYSALGAMLLAGATDLKEFIVAMLLSSATGFVLAGYHRRSSPSAEASIKYYLVGALANSAMLMGGALLFGVAGGTTFAALSRDLPAVASPATIFGVSLVIIGLAFKLGAVPVHTWVPDVAQGAPAPVAGFITSVPKVGAFIFLARFVLVLPPDSMSWQLLVAVIATATMTLGNLASLWQDDVRRLLGWSAVSQTGYGLLAIVALGRSELAVPALLFFLVAYVPGNLAAFGTVVALRGRTTLTDYAGVGRSRPWLAGSLAVSFLSFIGVPPLSGFVAKLLLFLVAIQVGYAWLAVVAAINTVVSIFYYVRVLAPTYFALPAGPIGTLDRGATLVTIATAGTLLAAGLAAEPFIAAFAAAPMVR
ncbi:MAG TPA: NADH-quinone oxidoreductase subunit N [Candidatus Limnocylindrales bacterium]|jgi:NADH-quinone oxidoreductase subunit N